MKVREGCFMTLVTEKEQSAEIAKPRKSWRDLWLIFIYGSQPTSVLNSDCVYLNAAVKFDLLIYVHILMDMIWIQLIELDKMFGNIGNLSLFKYVQFYWITFSSTGLLQKQKGISSIGTQRRLLGAEDSMVLWRIQLNIYLVTGQCRLLRL